MHYHQPFLWLSPPNQRPEWVEDSGNREISAVILSRQSTWLEPLPTLGQVCTEPFKAAHNRIKTVPVHARLPITLISLDGGTVWCSSCGPLVPSERVGLFQSSIEFTQPSMSCYSNPSLTLPQILWKTKVPPPPEIIEEPTVYQVREILDSRQRGGHLEYLIDWEGYGPEERSWVTLDGVLDPSLLTDYHHIEVCYPTRTRGSRNTVGFRVGFRVNV